MYCAIPLVKPLPTAELRLHCSSEKKHQLQALPVLAPILSGSSAIQALFTWMKGQTTHDARALKRGSRLPRSDDGTSAFVRGSDGQRGTKDAGLDHTVSVAVGSHGDLDEEIMRAEAGWVRHGDSVDLIGFVELDDLALAINSPFSRPRFCIPTEGTHLDGLHLLGNA